MTTEGARAHDVKAWLRRAATDLRAAEHERTAKPPITADMVFHAQQIVEKTLKAFLTWHDQPFRKTHNLVELGEQCAEIVRELEEILRQAAPLTEYAWKFRYPGESDEPTLQEADEAVAVARGLYQTILSRLPQEVHP